MRFMALPLVVCIALGATGTSHAQQIALITNVAGRTTTSLNGAWQSIVDPYETGFYDYRYRPRTDGFFQARTPRDRSDLVEYDFDASPRLHVPSDWNSQDERLFLYEGTVWYRRVFDYPLQPGARLFVHFGAANYEAHVYLNGTELGSHEGGFTPFNFEITELVRAEGNSLVVKVDNTRRLDAVPTVNTDWWNYGGLTRDVTLIELPATFVRDYVLQLAPGSTERIAGWVQLDGPAAAGREVTVRIPEAGVETTVRADADGRARIGIRADLDLWSPADPKLYDVEVAAADDRVSDRIGFRSIATRGTDILLNGEPVFLRGVCMHEQAPKRDGRANGREDARTLLEWVKELGGNFVRLAHYPHNESMVRMADELGLLVWAEVPVYWTIQWENDVTLANARRQLSEMITRDRNRAAVILWSMANETPPSDARLTFLQALARRARELDPTRLITAALELDYRLEDGVLSIDDPFGRDLDVLAVNEYLGWYTGPPQLADSVRWQSTYDKPLIVSEFGAGALQGYHADARTRWSEEYQASVYRHQVAMLRRIPFLRGVTPWILTDFRSPRRLLP
ncbi:MAG: glycoside hydrolase family 2 TIM barrel-domain containing protein, partial [Gemmatimonadales bacterium]